MSKFFIDLNSNTLDRFDMSRFMEYTNSYDPLTSAIFLDISSLPIGGQYTVQGEDGRPDLISYRVYGHTQYWWVLLLYNDILDYNNIITGNILKYPSLDAIEDFYFSLKSKETAARKT